MLGAHVPYDVIHVQQLQLCQDKAVMVRVFIAPVIALVGGDAKDWVRVGSHGHRAGLPHRCCMRELVHEELQLRAKAIAGRGLVRFGSAA